MYTDTEECIRAEIADVKEIPIRDRNEQDWIRLNDLVTEIQRRHPELPNGEFPSN